MDGWMNASPRQVTTADVRMNQETVWMSRASEGSDRLAVAVQSETLFSRPTNASMFTLKDGEATIM